VQVLKDGRHIPVVGGAIMDVWSLGVCLFELAADIIA
jgi:hypothetical protein